MEDSSKKQKLIASGVLAFIILAAISISVIPSTNTVANDNPAAPASISASPDALASPAEAAADYTDGTYKATGSYRTPESTETIDVTITVQNSVVTSSSVAQVPQDRSSEYYQNDFAKNYKTYVEGRSLDTINLSRVSGSSLTSGGFNKALAEIKKQAKA